MYCSLLIALFKKLTLLPTSLSAAQNLKLESSGEGYAAMNSAIEAAYKVGSRVVDNITGSWDSVKETPPSVK